MGLATAQRRQRLLGKEERLQRDQTVSEMAEEVLMRQAKDLARRSGRSLEDARQAVSGTEAGRRLKYLAMGEYRHEKASEWQASMFWERIEERFMRQAGSEALSRFMAERRQSSSRDKSDIDRPEVEEKRAPQNASVGKQTQGNGGSRTMTPEQVRPGMRVRVMEHHRVEERRGLVGKVVACYGDEDYVAMDVRLADGESRLFWPSDLEEIPSPARARWRLPLGWGSAD